MKYIISFAFIMLLGLASCTHKAADSQVNVTANDGNFPPAIAAIMITKCAIAGCHNQASYGNADSLLLDTWDHLFNGGSSGAEVVAYNAQYSPLMYFVNTDSTLGTIVAPAMPYSTPNRPLAPLTKTEYLALYNWIQSGAPDKNGNVPFASNADTRQKLYLTQQGCDLLSVIDAEKHVVMRYIPIGMNPTAIESPHCVRVSDDGMYAYVSFLAGDYVQKIDTRIDTVVSSAFLGSTAIGGSWNVVHISPANTEVITSDWVANGLLVDINANNMQVNPARTYNAASGGLVWPHGIEANATFDTFFLTSQYSNLVYKLAPSDFNYFHKISLDGNPPSTYSNSTGTTPNPHEILMVPDYSKFFTTCQGTNTVNVIDAHNDNIIATIPVGTLPQELAVSHTKPYMFVTCQEDGATTYPHAKGSVYVINYNTFQVVKILYGDFYQPHGITVDDINGTVMIASTNANPNGPAPHHVTTCGGRDGWYTFYDLNTLQPLNNRRYEVTVQPYSASTRFKVN
jgi:YVTN family beta-propeller protein